MLAGAVFAAPKSSLPASLCTKNLSAAGRARARSVLKFARNFEPDRLDIIWALKNLKQPSVFKWGTDENSRRRPNLGIGTSGAEMVFYYFLVLSRFGYLELVPEITDVIRLSIDPTIPATGLQELYENWGVAAIAEILDTRLRKTEGVEDIAQEAFNWKFLAPRLAASHPGLLLRLRSALLAAHYRVQVEEIDGR